eukprot:scaffold2660_cov257-Pinguiococcus_pyrenoidosus.AAC.15
MQIRFPRSVQRSQVVECLVWWGCAVLAAPGSTWGAAQCRKTEFWEILMPRFLTRSPPPCLSLCAGVLLFDSFWSLELVPLARCHHLLSMEDCSAGPRAARPARRPLEGAS